VDANNAVNSGHFRSGRSIQMLGLTGVGWGNYNDATEDFMVSCFFSLNNQTFSSFIYDGVSCTAFSGNGPDRNNPASVCVSGNGPIPLGNYYIVDRASGGRLGGIRDWFTGRDQWFALYRDDGTIDDETFIGSVRRGEFRLHPLGPSGTSLGCIVLQYPNEFVALRTYLLASPAAYIPGTGTRTYGTVTVGAGLPYMPSLLPPGQAYA
jgi:hypothetical protein